ncbi:hypothetical protein [Endozoicomonas sp. ALB091]|uniref:hypothetical protein n=1 Tax=Endozoicomonas sp. ALB091 TaxID=3403073 RepID=UPI003BB559AD
MSQQTEVIDKLFLELSQFTRARTEREMELAKAVERAFLAGLSIGNDPRFTMKDSRDQWEKYREVFLTELLDL